jgi:hypothetical protein
MHGSASEVVSALEEAAFGRISHSLAIIAEELFFELEELPAQAEDGLHFIHFFLGAKRQQL